MEMKAKMLDYGVIPKIEDRFLQSALNAYNMYKRIHNNAIESDLHANVLNQWLIHELAISNPSFKVSELTNNHENLGNISSKIRLENKAKLLVERDNQLYGVVNVDFINSFYGNSSSDYLLNQIGEVLNFCRSKIVYGNIICITDPVPITQKNGKFSWKYLEDFDLVLYHKLKEEFGYIHSDYVQAVPILKLNKRSREIEKICDWSDLKSVSKQAYQNLNTMSIKRFFPEFSKIIKRNHQENV